MDTRDVLDQIQIPSSRQLRIESALLLLREAIADARDFGRDVWEFAPTARALQASGLLETDLRWLIASGLAHHAIEQVTEGESRRQFRPAADLSVGEQSCFVLTELGVLFVDSGILPAERHADETAAKGLGRQALPRWDSAARVLRFHGCIVKQFRVPAPCQELVLEVLQEEGWPPRIDDPLPPTPGRDPQERLHDVVRRLNEGQQTYKIRFSRSGRGVSWHG